MLVDRLLVEGWSVGEAAKAASVSPLGVPIVLSQHPDEHCSEHSILLAVDQQLGEGSALWVAQNSPIMSARSRSGSMRTWSSSARGARPRASRRSRSRRSSSSGLTVGGYAVVSARTRVSAPDPSDPLGVSPQALWEMLKH